MSRWPTGADYVACVERFRSSVERIAALEPNWDSYGAPRIDSRCLDAAVKLWESIPGTDEWTLVPCSNGGVQLERHANGLDYEYMISPAPSGEKEQR